MEAFFLRIAKSLISKKRHRGQKLQCQLANEDDLQLKSVIKEIVFKSVYYLRIDYRRSSVMNFFNSTPY